MKAEYDLFVACRGAVRAVKGKTPTTLYLDDAVLDVFRLQAQNQGLGCQTLINKALRGKVLTRKPDPVTVADQQQVLREELHAVEIGLDARLLHQNLNQPHVALPDLLPFMH